MSTPNVGTRTGFDTYTFAGRRGARREAVHAARASTSGRGPTAWLTATIERFRKWRYDSRCRNDLATLSDRELKDIGLTRCDLHRVFRHELNEDLRTRF